MKFILLFITFTFVSCLSTPKVIVEKDLKSIIYEVAFTDAMVTKLASENIYNRDSIRFFEPILKKHGYTIDDFEYTIEKMVLRKSNVLPLLITELSDELEKRKINYQYKAKIVADWDHRADSIYSKQMYLDSMEIKKLDSLKNAIVKLNLDCSGELEVNIKYVIDTLDKNRVHLMTVLLKDTISGKENKARSIWLNKSTKMDRRKESTRIKYNAREYNQAIITFVEITKYGNDKNNKNKETRTKPYIDLDTMQVIYHYPKITARKMLIDSMLQIGKLKKRINNNIVYEKKDSSALSVYLK